MPRDDMNSSARRFRSDCVVALVMLLAAILLAVLLLASTRSSRDGLTGRFDNRAQLAAEFAGEYLHHVAERDLQIARSRLGGDLDEATLQQITADHGFLGVIVLDEHGRLLQGFPHAPQLINKDLGQKYAHLKGATGGTVSISDIVPSAAKGDPIVAIATPFTSPTGRRVFSAGFRIADTPLDTFIRSIHLQGASTYLVDGAGRIITPPNGSPGIAGSLLIDQHAELAPTLRQRSGEFELEGDAIHFASMPVKGTSWRVITTIPSASLYRPLKTVTHVQVALLLMLTALACVVTWLVKRLTQAEHRLTSQLNELAKRETRLTFLLHEVDRVRDDERRRIAEGIHDSSLQQMIAARMTLDHVSMTEKDQQLRILAKVGTLLDDAISATRSVLQDYSPLHTAHRPLEEALAMCARELQDTYLTTIVMDVDAPIAIDEERHLMIMRLMGEATVNACKHANASALRISGSIDTETLHLAIADDGCGFDYDRSRSLGAMTTGMGIPLMHERIRALGGDMVVTSAPGSGTTVKLSIPLGSRTICAPLPDNPPSNDVHRVAPSREGSPAPRRTRRSARLPAFRGTREARPNQDSAPNLDRARTRSRR